jgi:hypothetical protein
MYLRQAMDYGDGFADLDRKGSEQVQSGRGLFVGHPFGENPMVKFGTEVAQMKGNSVGIINFQRVIGFSLGSGYKRLCLFRI